MRYKNSFHNMYDPKYGTEFYESDSEPTPYLGMLICRRFRGCFDIVQDGVCLGSYAGINGAKQAIEERRCLEIMQDQGDTRAGGTTMTKIETLVRDYVKWLRAECLGEDDIEQLVEEARIASASTEQDFLDIAHDLIVDHDAEADPEYRVRGGTRADKRLCAMYDILRKKGQI